MPEVGEWVRSCVLWAVVMASISTCLWALMFAFENMWAEALGWGFVALVLIAAMDRWLRWFDRSTYDSSSFASQPGSEVRYTGKPVYGEKLRANGESGLRGNCLGQNVGGENDQDEYESWRKYDPEREKYPGATYRIYSRSPFGTVEYPGKILIAEYPGDSEHLRAVIAADTGGTPIYTNDVL